MLAEILLQLVTDLLRTLLIEAASQRVQMAANRLRLKLRSRGVRRNIKARVHARVRRRLIHRLTTGGKDQV